MRENDFQRKRSYDHNKGKGKKLGQTMIMKVVKKTHKILKGNENERTSMAQLTNSPLRIVLWGNSYS